MIPNPAILARVAAAVVKVRAPGASGLGTLIPNGYILTVCHTIRRCIRWDDKALLTPEPVEIETVGGIEFQASLAFADPVADLALLAPADAAFEGFREKTTPTPIGPLAADKTVYALTPEREWTETKVVAEGIELGILARSQLGAGSSGGPVVDSTGRLVAVLSACATVPREDGLFLAFCVQPGRDLPAWALRQIMAAQRAAEAELPVKLLPPRPAA